MLKRKVKRYTYEELQAKYNGAYSRHMQWLQLATEGYRYITPNRDGLNQYLEFYDVGIINTYNLYDATAPNAAVERANQLTRMLMPDNQKWGSLVLDPKIMQKFGISVENVQMMENLEYQYINQSDLSQQIQDCFVDECMGSGALWIETPSDDVPLFFQSIPAFAVMPEYYCGSIVRDLWYVFSCTALYIKENYPDMDPNLSSYFDGVLSTAPQTLFWIKRGIIYDPNEEGEWRYIDLLNIGTMKSNDPLNGACLKDYNLPFKKLIYFRDRVRPGEVCGRGPGIEYMPFIKRLNTLRRLSLQATEIRANPPTEIDYSKIDTSLITNFAGSTFPIGTFGKSFIPGEAPSVENEIEKLTQEIQKGFSVQPIGGLNQPVRSATEVSARLDADRQNTTIDVSRLLRESSAPVFETIFAILVYRGKLPFSDKLAPLLRQNTKTIIFNYINPLGDIQKMNNMVKFQNFAQVAQQFISPEWLPLMMNVAKIQNFLRDNSGLPVENFKDGAVLQSALASVLNQMQQANTAQNGQQNAQSNAPASLPASTTTAQPFNAPTLQGINL